MSIIFYMSRITPQTYERLIAGEPLEGPGSDEVSLEKSWDVLRRFLKHGHDRGSTRNLALAISGGEQLDPNGDYGAPRALSPGLVAQIVHDLDGEDAPEERRQPFDEDEIRSIYEDVDQTGAYGAPDSVESGIEYFHILDAFYRRAAAAGDAVLIELC